MIELFDIQLKYELIAAIDIKYESPSIFMEVIFIGGSIHKYKLLDKSSLLYTIETHINNFREALSFKVKEFEKHLYSK